MFANIKGQTYIRQLKFRKIFFLKKKLLIPAKKSHTNTWLGKNQKEREDNDPSPPPQQEYAYFSNSKQPGKKILTYL